MKATTATAIFALAVAAVAAPATAASLFRANLSGTQEVLPNASTASGFGSILVSDDMNSIDVSLNWTGLTTPAVAGHIHCCAPIGSNVRVAIGLAPAAATSGSLFATFDLTSAATYTTGFITNNGGTTASARTAFLAGLAGGNAYFNLHNATFPGGEIRGQLAAVPEPASWAMLIGGFGLTGAAMRRKRLAVA